MSIILGMPNSLTSMPFDIMVVVPPSSKMPFGSSMSAVCIAGSSIPSSLIICVLPSSFGTYVVLILFLPTSGLKLGLDKRCWTVSFGSSSAEISLGSKMVIVPSDPVVMVVVPRL